MRILIVAATAMEIAPIVAALRHTAERGPRLTRHNYAGHDVDVLVTGVGMVATAAWSSRALGETRYDFALNLGVCGSFDRANGPGQVVHVVSDCLAELGAEDGDAFLSIQQLSLPAEHEFSNLSPPANAALAALPEVDGITVNTVHGSERSIAMVAQRANQYRQYRPQVESMEGAAFMYACQIHGVAYAQVRAVSNVVEKRNPNAWKMADAIENLGRTALRILEHA